MKISKNIASPLKPLSQVPNELEEWWLWSKRQYRHFSFSISSKSYLYGEVKIPLFITIFFLFLVVISWACTSKYFPGLATDWLHFHFSRLCTEEGNGNPLQCSCLENPRDGEPGGLLSMGLHRVGHDWSDLAAAAGLIENTRHCWGWVGGESKAAFLQHNQADFLQCL